MEVMITITFIPFPSTTDWQPNPSHQKPTRPCKHGEWIKLESVETMVSYNVTSLFTCFLNSKSALNLDQIFHPPGSLTKHYQFPVQCRNMDAPWGLQYLPSWPTSTWKR